MFNITKPSAVRCVPVARGKGLPITVVCGFLGSGKTTLLRRWKLDRSLRNPAVIINDLCSFGIDAELLSNPSLTSQNGNTGDHVSDLHGVLTWKNRYASMGRVLEGIESLNPVPTHVFCESTGMARPWQLISALTQNKMFHLRHFIVTIDALNFHRDFADGLVLTGEVGMSEDLALRVAAEVLAEQIFFASAIILTKADTVPNTVIETQIRVLNKLQPTATIGLSTLDGFSHSHLDVASQPNIEELRSRAQQFGLDNNDSRSNDVVSISVQDPRPFHPQRLYDVFQSQLGTGVYRTKGLLWLCTRPDDVIIWHQSGSQVGFELINTWSDILQNKHDRPIEATFDRTTNRLAEDPTIFGNRGNKLTVIGLPNDCRVFATALRSALCTDAEMNALKRGEVFMDPWPQTRQYVT